MTRVEFTQQLEEIQDEMFGLASMVEAAISRGVKALVERDVRLAQQVVADDLQVNRKRYDIEERCLEIIATQQPLASDLRTIIAVLYIIVDLERMGDHAEGIAKIAIMLADEPASREYVKIPKMANVASRMLTSSLEAFKNRDARRARSLCDEDDEVDDLYDDVYQELLKRMVDDPETTEHATRLIWVAHNLERIADRVTNICERVVYLVEGRIQELNVSSY